MTDKLKTLLDDRGLLLADGATGTNLFALGLQTGDSPELWNIDHPERITSLHRSFVNAGSDIILTNSFGGTHYRLGLHKAGHRVAELNTGAARLARIAADESERTVLVAGSMGPTGEILQPNGSVSIDEARQAFAEQAEALAEGGADILWIETISSAEEIEAAVLGAAEVGLPIVYTVSIDTNGRTMMGLTPAEALRISTGLNKDITAIGSNCGVGASEVVAAICNLANAARTLDISPVLVAKANCGIPEYVNGKIVYSGTPELMADYAVLAANAGASIIGGCCGTTPAHVQAMRHAIDEWQPGSESPDVDTLTRVLGELSLGARAQMAGDLSIAGGSASGRGSRHSRRKRTNP
ncbi:betaine--homocysteine S-methyltransferase [Granulosicoccus antarcticus]|uniref:Bifunctional homocysteine S-methyltransferase/5,10-methylenetetrahydrofolate reductase n=1 Tax=Granulosicoccus antarcticus IMCC3135 TaxID=1192854 RepID=A0A2Z2P0H1_9GAMM|nr:betaine--homocysteine S-methyltransferase [Granulosicoccus antarcticus]ASJ75598.1 Bifunctional homocysteine S-methyltransferase/5,10-methylenetetrahydrofolate reductase [Granulosicoccus antarcticus IMCC3135]